MPSRWINKKTTNMGYDLNFFGGAGVVFKTPNEQFLPLPTPLLSSFKRDF